MGRDVGRVRRSQALEKGQARDGKGDKRKRQDQPLSDLPACFARSGACVGCGQVFIPSMIFRLSGDRGGDTMAPRAGARRAFWGRGGGECVPFIQLPCYPYELSQKTTPTGEP
jgi:hypothetical protein